MQTKGFINTTVLLIIWVIVSIIILGSIYWLFFRPRPQTPQPTQEASKPVASIAPRIGGTFSGQLGKDEIKLQDDYVIYYSLPLGMKFEEGDGVYSGYVTDKDNFRLIGFIKSANQELTGTPMGAVLIDNVPFNLYYKSEVTCGVELRPQKPKYSETEPLKNLLQLRILTWCGDYQENDQTFKRVVSSIWFSPKLKKFLNGEETGPILKKYAAPQ